MFFKDMKETLSIFPVWLLMAKYDIVARYRRTTFGPWWITLGTGFSLLCMGVVWSFLFKMEIKELLPYLSIGFVFWGFISSVTMESPLLLVTSSPLLKTIKIPPIAFILTSILKNFIILLHNIVIIGLVLLVFRVKVSPIIFLVVPGILLVFLATFFSSLILAFLGARLRDLSHIVSSLMTFVFLLTPIMWKIDMLPEKARYIAYLNPFTHFITILREPLLNRVPNLVYYYGSCIIVGVLGILAVVCYRKLSKKIIYWI